MSVDPGDPVDDECSTAIGPSLRAALCGAWVIGVADHDDSSRRAHRWWLESVGQGRRAAGFSQGQPRDARARSFAIRREHGIQALPGIKDRGIAEAWVWTRVGQILGPVPGHGHNASIKGTRCDEVESVIDGHDRKAQDVAWELSGSVSALTEPAATGDSLVVGAVAGAATRGLSGPTSSPKARSTTSSAEAAATRDPNRPIRPSSPRSAQPATHAFRSAGTCMLPLARM